MQAVMIALNAVDDPIKMHPMIATNNCEKKCAFSGVLRVGLTTPKNFRIFFEYVCLSSNVEKSRPKLHRILLCHVTLATPHVMPETMQQHCKNTLRFLFPVAW